MANLSPLPLGQIDLLSRVLKGETLVPADNAFRILRSLPHGHVQAVLGMIRRRGIEPLIASRPCRERNLVVAMIAQRILQPSSKLAATRLWETTTLAEELEVDLARRFGHPHRPRSSHCPAKIINHPPREQNPGYLV